MTRLRSLCLIVALSAITCMIGGCGSSQKVETRTTTVGQELQDLDTARNKGLITEEEYQKQRKQIMNQK